MSDKEIKMVEGSAAQRLWATTGAYTCARSVRECNLQTREYDYFKPEIVNYPAVVSWPCPYCKTRWNDNELTSCPSCGAPKGSD